MDGNIWQKGVSVTGSMAATLSFPVAGRPVGHSGFLFTQWKGVLTAFLTDESSLLCCVSWE